MGSNSLRSPRRRKAAEPEVEPKKIKIEVDFENCPPATPEEIVKILKQSKDEELNTKLVQILQEMTIKASEINQLRMAVALLKTRDLVDSQAASLFIQKCVALWL
ncbi:hypothetical protein L596_016568 [Steinernema carpocapsae]|uniref:Uncharacterized protein n=1 Tax=Steinernema carpocapsae TaxID=34508 RepID=A0A4U5NIB9_STECR|nr:hypothetical protein L596_016568 [Steinernema carpocapsae]